MSTHVRSSINLKLAPIFSSVQMLSFHLQKSFFVYSRWSPGPVVQSVTSPFADPGVVNLIVFEILQSYDDLIY